MAFNHLRWLGEIVNVPWGNRLIEMESKRKCVVESPFFTSRVINFSIAELMFSSFRPDPSRCGRLSTVVQMFSGPRSSLLVLISSSTEFYASCKRREMCVRYFASQVIGAVGGADIFADDSVVLTTVPLRCSSSTALCFFLRLLPCV